MKKVFKGTALLAGTVLVAAVAVGCGGSGGAQGGDQQAAAAVEGMPDPLVMGIIPAEDNSEMLRQYEPIVEYMSKELGVEVEPYTATDYSGIIESMRSGDVQVAWFGPLSYVLATEVAGAEAIAVQQTEEGQDPTYKSLIVTQPDSDIQSIEDLQGKTFSFVDPASTSGNLFPRKAMVDAGLEPDTDLAEATYAGGHDASALAVANGDVEAGAVADSTLESMVSEGVMEEGDLRVVAESDPIPESPIAVSEDLPEPAKQQLKELFLGMTPETVGAETLGSEDAIGYVEAKDEDYQAVRDLVETLDLNLEELAN